MIVKEWKGGKLKSKMKKGIFFCSGFFECKGVNFQVFSAETLPLNFFTSEISYLKTFSEFLAVSKIEKKKYHV